MARFSLFAHMPVRHARREGFAERRGSVWQTITSAEATSRPGLRRAIRSLGCCNNPDGILVLELKNESSLGVSAVRCVALRNKSVPFFLYEAVQKALVG